MTHYSLGYSDDKLSDVQNALATWTRSHGDCGYFHVGDLAHSLYNSIHGRFPLSEVVQVWYIGTAIIGIVVCEPHYENFNVFVSPAQKGDYFEYEMLKQGYRITRHTMNKIGLGENPVVIGVRRGDWQRVQAIESLGFELDRHWFNITELSLSEALPEPILPEGFSLRPARMEDYAELAAVHSSAFNETWTPELYRDEVMLKPAYTPEREFVIVTDAGQIVAFAQTWLDEINKVGLFEPVGVHSDFQRRGLGRAIMLYGLRDIQNHGMKTAKVAHGIRNQASTGLYKSLGFHMKHEVIGYKRQ